MKCRSGGVCRLCLSSRLSSGPPDDPSSCSFEGSSQDVWVSINSFFPQPLKLQLQRLLCILLLSSFVVCYIGITLEVEV